ncbi:hypothetical protein MKX47_10525 [Solibacillus sp. FSL R7-0668]|uniref:hypothetical protein n=1 Tax=Solibacillus sp. FSL R7-0668 TaxID=2921688 RepID=UPI0030F53131
MELMSQSGLVYWLSFIPPLFFISCFYFTLTFFQQLKVGDETRIKKAKMGAILSLILALFIPAIAQMIMFFLMMR